jgi:hypothetical protein
MKIATRNRITPIAEGMKRGIKPTEEEIQVLRAAAAEAGDTNFRTLLESIGNESTLRDCRQTGKKLFSEMRFATGARRKNDLAPGIPRPEKIKRRLRKGK